MLSWAISPPSYTNTMTSHRESSASSQCFTVYGEKGCVLDGKRERPLLCGWGHRLFKQVEVTSLQDICLSCF